MRHGLSNKCSWSRIYKYIGKEGSTDTASMESKFWIGASCFFKVCVKFSYYF